MIPKKLRQTLMEVWAPILMPLPIQGHLPQFILKQSQVLRITIWKAAVASSQTQTEKYQNPRQKRQNRKRTLQKQREETQLKLPT